MENEKKIFLSSGGRYTHTLQSISNDESCVIPFQDEDYLKKLCENFVKAKKERDTVTKSFVYLLGILFLITNESDFNIPVLKMKISELPNVTQVVLILSSFAVILLVLKFKDTMMYDEFIDLVLKKKHGGNRRERDVIKAAYTNESLSFKIYNYPYFPGDYELFSIGKLGSFFNVLVGMLLLTLFITLMIVPIVFLFYVSYSHIPNDNIGIMVSGISQFMLAISLVLIFSSFIKFPHKYKQGEWNFD